MLKLNLGAGTDLKENETGWLNLDVVKRWAIASRDCDIIWDARTDRIPFDDNSADGIHVGYLLMHLAPCFHAPLLAEIRRVAKPDAPIVFDEVDMSVLMRRWLADPSNPNLCELIWGEQGSVHGAEQAEFDKHCHGFTEGSLRALLEVSGFRVLGRQNIHAPGVWYALTLCATKDA